VTNKLLTILIPIVAVVAAAASLWHWFRPPDAEAMGIGLRVPLSWDVTVNREPDPRPDRLEAGPGQPPEGLEGTWPQFRGAARDGKAVTDEPLLTVWPRTGPRVLWRTAACEGHAGAAIYRGRVYLLDYDESEGANVLRCLSLVDGKDIWRYVMPWVLGNNHGFTRTVPAVNDNYVVAIDPACNVLCVDARTGQLKWKKDLVTQFGATVPQWYTAQCPLIDGDRVILAPAGEPFMVAVDLATGDVRWRTANPGGWTMTHSSITPADFGGVRQYLYCGSYGVLSVAADDGRVLWMWDEWNSPNVWSPSPVVVGPDLFLVTGDYDAGSQLVRVRGGRNGQPLQPEAVATLQAGEFACKQQTPIADRDHVFTVLPDGRVACLDSKGQVRWTSESKVSSGWGPFLFINDRLYAVHDQTGELVVADAGPHGYRELARAKVLTGHEAWAPMAFADGRLILRDSKEVVCLDLTAGQKAGQQRKEPSASEGEPEPATPLETEKPAEEGSP
jgi:outer membrane protein assembly factor BamB